ncbi:hypothetical protein BC826DRAFT_1062198 [Russula brevipes]|nr:hypothetical protein BC826DRAFT_1062198 [Russula brevipes]
MSTFDGSNSSISMGECDAPGSRVAEARGQCWGPQTGTIGALPNDVLLEVFGFYLDEEENEDAWQSWPTLVHVCQSWRFIVFTSPRRLNLRLFCTDRTRAREMLDVWPAFLPIVIQDMDGKGIDEDDEDDEEPFIKEERADNVIAALEHNSRVRQFSYWGDLVPRFAAAMRRPFPELTDLHLWVDDELTPTLPESFLGGSAPRLRVLRLDKVRVPGLQRILSSASDLVCLYLTDFPNSGFVPPEAMVACLSTIRSPLPLKRTVLPALTSLTFKGTSEYSEDFVARIDAPLLVCIRVVFHHQLFFRTLQLLLFIDVTFFLGRPFRSSPAYKDGSRSSCVGSLMPRRLRYATFVPGQICTLSSSLFSKIERLEISQVPPWGPFDEYQLGGLRWLELLHPFLSVKDLYLSEEIALLAVPFLHTEVLPALQNLFVGGLQSSGAIKEATGISYLVRKAKFGEATCILDDGPIGLLSNVAPVASQLTYKGGYTKRVLYRRRWPGICQEVLA